MATIEQRVSKLEDRFGPNACKLIVLSANGEFSEDDAKDFLRGEGIVTTDADLVVRLLTFYEERDGSTANLPPSPRLLSVTAR